MAEPDITLQAVHVSAGSNLPIGRVVIHTTSPTNWSFPETSQPPSAHGTAQYFQNDSSGGSAHYIEDTLDEEHCVAEAAIAWHAPPNSHSIGIEICGSPDYTPEQWLSPTVWPAVLHAAERTADICERHSIPKVRIGPDELVAGAQGICGHVDVSQAWHQTDHTDPGVNFPWDDFISAVNGLSTSSTVSTQSQEDEVDQGYLDAIVEIRDNVRKLTAASGTAEAVKSLTDADLAAIAKAVNDETARRQQA